MAFSPDRRDTIVYAVFTYANALIVLVLLAGAVVTANRPAPPDGASIMAEHRTTAEANRAHLSTSLRSYAVVTKQRRPRLDIHFFGLPGASSLHSAVEKRLLDAIEDAGGFADREAFEPVQTAPAHRWSTTSFTSPPSRDGNRTGDSHTLGIHTTVLTSGGRYIVTALEQTSPQPHTTVLLTDLTADTTVDAQTLFSDRVDSAEISADSTGSLTVEGRPVTGDDLTEAGRSVTAELHTPLEIPQPGDLRSPDFSCALLPCVALTYDDGPGEARTEDALLTAADEANIRLTYFLLGRNIREFPDVAERIAAAGHEVDNHTDKHQRLDLLDPEALRHEISRTQTSLTNVGGSDPALIRPPYGALDKQAAHALGGPAIIWDVDTGDWRDKSPKTIVKRIDKHTRPGSVVLMHSIHPSTVKAAPHVFAAVADKGLYAVTVRELFAGIEWEKGGSYFCRGYWSELCSNPEHPSVHKN